MLNINLKARFRNKAFIVSLVSAIVLLLQQVGLKQFIPMNWVDILNAMLTILILLGAVVDTSTPGINDVSLSQATVQAINSATDNNVATKTESTTTAINNTVTENSASSKITVDNPGNIKSIGQEVNAISAVKPQ